LPFVLAIRSPLRACEAVIRVFLLFSILFGFHLSTQGPVAKHFGVDYHSPLNLHRLDLLTLPIPQQDTKNQ
jgi:hypothetical protein